MAIDWTKPIEFLDGTPAVLVDTDKFSLGCTRLVKWSGAGRVSCTTMTEDGRRLAGRHIELQNIPPTPVHPVIDYKLPIELLDGTKAVYVGECVHHSEHRHMIGWAGFDEVRYLDDVGQLLGATAPFIRNVPGVEVRWLNVWPSGIGSDHKTVASADRAAEDPREDRIGRIRITYRPGQMDD